MAEPIRVLHVDDDPDFLSLTAAFLERTEDRFVVETAARVHEGLDRLADADHDCIVSDYEMPDRTGLEFLEAVREEYPTLPFILFTGKGSEEIATEHDWAVEVTESEVGGPRVEFSNVGLAN